MDQERIKRLDLLGGLGAGVLGAGLALLFAQWLAPFAIPVLILGIGAHGWAMYHKGCLERREGLTLPRWTSAAEGICWILLGLLVVYIAQSLFSRPGS